MNDNKLLYEKFKAQYSKEELVESFIFPSSLSPEEKKKAEEEFRKLRMEKLKNRSDAQILHGELMRMKLLIEDYFLQDNYIDSFSFSEQLKNYISLLKKPHHEFAADIGIHKTKLSRILNNKENPNIDIMFRLELHSGAMIPATHWFKLHIKKQENEIRLNKKKRQEENKKVKNKLNFKKTA